MNDKNFAEIIVIYRIYYYCLAKLLFYNCCFI